MGALLGGDVAFGTGGGIWGQQKVGLVQMN